MKHLLIVEPLALKDPLVEWRWKIGGGPIIVALTRSGDAFVSGAKGDVWWLDAGAGAFTQVAESVSQFWEALQTPEQMTSLLLAPVVDAFIAEHGPFPIGTCLGFKQLPALGGSYSPDNRYILHAVDHFTFTGEAHRQMRDLPDGAKVTFKIVP